MITTGLTTPGKVREHLPFITAPPTYDNDHLTRLLLRGTQTDSIRAGLKLTPLLVEETTDPPDSVYKSGHQAESIEGGQDDAGEASQERSSETRRENQSRFILRLTGLGESSVEDVEDDSEEATRETLSQTRKEPQSRDYLRLARRRDSKRYVHDPKEIQQENAHGSRRAPGLAHGRNSMSAINVEDDNEEEGASEGSPRGIPDERANIKGREQNELEERGSSDSSTETDSNSETAAKTDSTEDGTRVKEQKGASKNFSTAMPRGESHKSSVKTDLKSEENGENDGGDGGTSERSSVGGSDKRRKLKVKAKEDQSRHFSTTSSQVNSLKYSIETDRNSGKIRGNDGGEDSERSSGGGLDERRKPRIKEKEGPKKHILSALSQQENFHPADNSIGSDRKADKVGKNENVEGRTRGVSSGSGSDERKKLRMKAQEGSSRHLSKAISQEDSLKPVGPSTETDRNEKDYGQSSIDEGSTREGPSRGGHGTDKSSSRGRSRMITHEGSSRNASTVIPRERERHGRNRTNSFVNIDRHSETTDENDDENDYGDSGEGSSGSGGSEPKGPLRHVSASIPQGDNLNPLDSSKESDSTSEKIVENYNGEDGNGEGPFQGGTEEPPSRWKSRPTTQEGPSAVHGTSVVQHTSTTVPPDTQTASTEIRWSVHHQQGLIETNRFKKKKKLGKEEDEDVDEEEEHVSPSTVAAIVAGLLAAAMVLLVIGTFCW